MRPAGLGGLNGFVATCVAPAGEYRYGLVVRIEGFHSFGPGSIPGIGNRRFYRPVVRTSDFESGNPSSILGRTFFALCIVYCMFYTQKRR